MKNTISIKNSILSKRSLSIASIVLALAGSFLAIAPSTYAATSVPLGAADTFAVLAGSTITNTGTTTITGSVGVHTGNAYTGAGSTTLLGGGTYQLGTQAAADAKAAALTAYNNAASQSPATAIGVELGSTTRLAGVYTSGTFGLTGTLTLNAEGNANAVFIFRAASTLVTAGASEVRIINGGSACNVFWQIGSSATLGASSTLLGTVLADTRISAGTSATVQGRLFARSGAVELSGNTITKSTCPAAVVGGTNTGVTPVYPTPTPTPTPTVAPVICPTFTTNPSISKVTTNSITAIWSGVGAKSWASRTGVGDYIAIGNGNLGTVTRTGLAPGTKYTIAIALFSGLDQTGCRVAFPITGTTASQVKEPTPTPTPKPVLVPEVCPTFVSEPSVQSTTANSLTLSWSGTNAKSWSLDARGMQTSYFGNENPNSLVITNLTPSTTYTRTVVLWSGLKQTGCSISLPITGSTDSVVAQATPTPEPTPTPVATPTPTPTPRPQVTIKPRGPVRTGDGSLGRGLRQR